jgi:CHASE2 domain-containing sensor protein
MYTNYNAGFALLGGVRVSTSSSARMGIVAFLAILTVSAGTMLWLFWRFPLMTAIVTLAVFAALVVLARLARSIEVDMQDLDRTEQSV